jgi:Fe-S-cluster containining protein
MCVRLFPGDIRFITKFLNLPRLEFIKVFCIVAQDTFHFTDCSVVIPRIELKKKANGACIFLDENECRIYKKRPLLCRNGPFTLGFMRSKKYFDLFRTYCKGLGMGRLHTSGEIETKLENEEKIEKKYENDVCNGPFFKSIFNTVSIQKRETRIAKTYKEFSEKEDA